MLVVYSDPSVEIQVPYEAADEHDHAAAAALAAQSAEPPLPPPPGRLPPGAPAAEPIGRWAQEADDDAAWTDLTGPRSELL
eukprot:12908814-Prorocentrum_lima.AAC.1